MQAAQSLSIDAAEVEKFSALAAEWWNPSGKFAVLHKFNPVRLKYIKEHVCAQFDRDPHQRAPLDGLSLLDIGCGGGLLSEPMARLGAKVTAIDPSEKNIKTAMVHAEQAGLEIEYRATTAEELHALGAQFDIILNMEVIEHVAQPAVFAQTCAQMVKPGGMMFLATINRTLKAFGLAIVGAEYVLGWLPKGTHQWEKFITPDELKAWLASAGMQVDHETGVIYNPLRQEWRCARDMDVNYMLASSKTASINPRTELPT